jgi:hypothetical protein
MIKKLYAFFVVISAAIFLISCSSDEDKLFKAIKNGDIEEVRSIVENGVSVLSSNNSGLTALEVARLNNQVEIAEYLYEETKKIFDKETELLLKIKYNDDLSDLIKLDKERIKYSALFTDLNNRIDEYISDDKRLSDDLLSEQEKYFRIYQKLLKDFVNAKVDLIENILSDFVDKDFVSSIESRDARQIVNSNVLSRLSKSE